jgi:hypothetical protein
VDASKRITDDPAVHERVVRETLRIVEGMSFDRPPPWMGQRIHRILRETTGNPDPYRTIKLRSNTLALELYPSLNEQVRASADPFEAAIRIAIAGNVIDFGCRRHVSDDEIHQEIENALKPGSLQPNGGAVGALRAAIEQASDILYLADNAGEIVFDRLLIEQMPTDRVTLVVRGSPVINDVTLEDADAAGLSSLVRVIDNGSDAPGTILESCSDAFLTRFSQSDLVIAKGQGNFEALAGANHDIFFLFKAKCDVIARHAGCRTGDLILSRNRELEDAGQRAAMDTHDR